MDIEKLILKHTWRQERIIIEKLLYKRKISYRILHSF
jgi:hypothetical protein